MEIHEQTHIYQKMLKPIDISDRYCSDYYDHFVIFYHFFGNVSFLVYTVDGCMHLIKYLCWLYIDAALSLLPVMSTPISYHSGVLSTLLHAHQSMFIVSVVTHVYTMQMKFYVTC